MSDEDGLGLAEGDELMILDSGFGGFDLSESQILLSVIMRFSTRVWLLRVL